MVDIVIPLRTELQPCANLELKYALRSIEQYLENVGNIFIIGGTCPQWLNLQTIEYIPYIEKNWFTHLTRNINEKLKIACISHNVSDYFLYFNDDHFLLERVDAAAYPFYHGGAEFGGKGQYRKATVPDTITLLKQEGHAEPIYNYDVHTPMLINKQQYLNKVAGLDWKKDFGYCIKTSYAYLTGAHVHGVPFDDLKIHKAPKNAAQIEAMLLDRHIFSTGEKAFRMSYDATGIIPGPLMLFMEETYPKKSKYEI